MRERSGREWGGLRTNEHLGMLRARAGGAREGKVTLGMGRGAWACGEGGRGEDDLAPEGRAEVRGHAG